MEVSMTKKEYYKIDVLHKLKNQAESMLYKIRELKKKKNLQLIEYERPLDFVFLEKKIIIQICKIVETHYIKLLSDYNNKIKKIKVSL
jgi:hypothetical protein